MQRCHPWAVRRLSTREKKQKRGEFIIPPRPNVSLAVHNAHNTFFVLRRPGHETNYRWQVIVRKNLFMIYKC